jgi:hypothetical protein
MGAAAAILLGLALVLRENERSRGALFAVWAVGPLLLAFALIGVMRIKAYYFLFVLPPLVCLAALSASIVGRELIPKASRVQWIAPAALIAVYAVGFGEFLIGRQKTPSRGDVPAVVAQLHAELSRTVVFDPDYLHSLLVYYAAKDPVQARRSCRYDLISPERPFVDCSFDGWRMVGLTHSGSVSPGWEPQAARKLVGLRREGPIWYLSDPNWRNPLVDAALERDCKGQDFAWHRLYYCPALTAAR